MGALRCELRPPIWHRSVLLALATNATVRSSGSEAFLRESRSRALPKSLESNLSSRYPWLTPWARERIEMKADYAEVLRRRGAQFVTGEALADAASGRPCDRGPGRPLGARHSAGGRITARSGQRQGGRGSVASARNPVPHAGGVAGADEDGGVLGEVTAGETVAEDVVVGVLGTVGVTGVVVAVGVADGVGVALGVVVGVDVGAVEGAGVDVVAGGDWTGPTRLGPVLRRPVSISAIASATTAPTAIAPPVAMPAAKEWCSRRYSVSRRSRSQAGSAARRAAQLLNGAAAMPSV